MEYRKEYKKVQATIEECEKQLAVCESLSTSCEQSGDYAVRQIEDYFAVCMNALARRKQTLVEEVKQKVEQNKQRIQETRVKLETSIEACKQTLKASALIHEVNSTKAEEILNVIAFPSIHPLPLFSLLPLSPLPFPLFPFSLHFTIRLWLVCLFRGWLICKSLQNFLLVYWTQFNNAAKYWILGAFR
jgi:hypothetical protein